MCFKNGFILFYTQKWFFCLDWFQTQNGFINFKSQNRWRINRSNFRYRLHLWNDLHQKTFEFSWNKRQDGRLFEICLNWQNNDSWSCSCSPVVRLQNQLMMEKFWVRFLLPPILLMRTLRCSVLLFSVTCKLQKKNLNVI